MFGMFKLEGVNKEVRETRKNRSRNYRDEYESVMDLDFINSGSVEQLDAILRYKDIID